MIFRRRKRQRRTWPQRLLILFNSLLVVVCLAGAFSVDYVRGKADELPVVNLPGTRATSESGQPINILLVGTDSDARLDSDDPITRGREESQLADVVMILRLDPTSQSASLISVPRDSYMPIAPRYSKSRINSAFSGPGEANDLIATIRHNFAISIDHYVQVDFRGFRDVIEVLGGIPVYLEAPVKDSRTGLWLVETGCITIDPPQALAYARSRNLSYQDADGDWVLDTTVDLGRITRQQDFLQAVAKRAIEKGIRNPSTALGLVDAGLKVVRVDDSLRVGDVTDLVSDFSSFSVDELDRYQVPTVYAPRGGADYQDVVWDEIDATLDIFRNYDADVDPSERDVLVDVVHTDDEEAEVFAAFLDTSGFDADVSTASSRSSYSESSTVLYGPKGAAAARLLAAHLSGAVEYEFSSELTGMRIELIVGDNPATVRQEPENIELVPSPTIPLDYLESITTTTASSTATTTTSVLPEASTTTEVIVGSSPETSTLETGTTTTTTTAPGFVPLDADAADRCG